MLQATNDAPEYRQQFAFGKSLSFWQASLLLASFAAK
jgi:hypothetical protein